MKLILIFLYTVLGVKRKLSAVTSETDEAVAALLGLSSESLHHVQFSKTNTQSLICERFLGLLKSVADSMLAEAIYFLECVIATPTQTIEHFMDHIVLEFPSSLLRLEMLQLWLAIIPGAIHAMMVADPSQTTDTILYRAMADPDEWERRIEIWWHYCVDYSVPGCVATSEFTPEALKEYFEDYRDNLIQRKEPEYLAFGLNIPAYMLNEAYSLATVLEHAFIPDMDACWNLFKEHVLSHSLTQEQFVELCESIVEPLEVPLSLYNKLMANSEINADDLAESLGEATDLQKNMRLIKIWRHFNRGPVEIKDSLVRLSPTDIRDYMTNLKVGIADALWHESDFTAERVYLNSLVAETGNLETQFLYDKVLEKFPTSRFRLCDTRKYIQSVAEIAFAPFWLPRMLREHRGASVSELHALMTGESMRTFANRPLESIARTVSTWRELTAWDYDLNDHQSLVRSEPTYMMIPNALRRVFKNQA